jgi:hypothetical protein
MVTSTKRKAIAREMAHHEGVVSITRVQALSNRYHLTQGEIASCLSAMGYTVARPEPIHSVKPEPRVKVETVPQEVLSAILSGSIYKVVGDGSGDPRETFVVTTLERFNKEREAISKLLKEISFPVTKQ